MHYCPTTRKLLIGTKTNLRSDTNTISQLADKHMQPIKAEKNAIKSVRHHPRKVSESLAMMVAPRVTPAMAPR